MNKRRGVVAIALATALSVASVSPAVAAPQSSNASTTLSSKNGATELSTQAGSTDSSSQDAAKQWDSLGPITKVIVGIFGATALFTVLGMSRTLFYNIFHI